MDGKAGLTSGEPDWLRDEYSVLLLVALANCAARSGRDLAAGT